MQVIRNKAAGSHISTHCSGFISKLWKYKLLYLLISGALAWTVIFCYLPMFGVVMAFQDFNIFKGFLGSKFVGLDNFTKIFTEPVFLKAIGNTLLYSSVILFAGFPCPIILALMFNEIRGRFFKRFVQTVSYLPYFLSWISVVALFYAFFEMSGPFNDFKALFLGPDMERTNILMNPDNFLGILYGSNLWKNLGWSSVIFLASITGIDPQLYEAAVIDGCGRWKQTIHITIPGILPTIMIIFILQSGSLVTSNFEQVFGFHNLYTMEQTQVVNTVVYKMGVQQGNYSIATAFGLAQGIVSFIIVYVVNRISRRASNISIW